jgi:hypothetical protein
VRNAEFLSIDAVMLGLIAPGVQLGSGTGFPFWVLVLHVAGADLLSGGCESF